MVTTAERKQLREELVSNGYSWDYIDSWQPKTVLYRHASGLDVNGKVSSPVGTPIKGIPGNPDYVARKSRLGMLPYPPTDSCECKWCVERAGGAEVIKAVKDIADGWKEKQEDGASVVAIDCQECEYKAEALTQPGALSKLRIHAKIHEGTGTV